MARFSSKFEKNSFLGYFGPFLPKFGEMGFSPKYWTLPLFSHNGPLTSFKNLEKTNEPILRKLCYGWTHGWTDGRTDGQTCIHKTLLANRPGSKIIKGFQKYLKMSILVYFWPIWTKFCTEQQFSKNRTPRKFKVLLKKTRKII